MTTLAKAEGRKFCDPVYDGLGMRCKRCGCWKRGENAPDCPPYITRCEPDAERLPHIKSASQNSRARAEYFAKLESEIANPPTKDSGA